MTLRQKQCLFTLLAAKLVLYSYSIGYEMTHGGTFRDPRWKGPGMGKMPEKSLHGLRLAADFNLFRDGKFLTTTEDHKPLGEWWEKQHPLCRWGGRFEDGNHYSLEHNGVK